jgi:hypothetical protein
LNGKSERIPRSMLRGASNRAGHLRKKGMPSFYSRLKELYLNKPECVITLPEWLLPSEKIKEYRAMSRLAIVEIAGRDSVAAAVPENGSAMMGQLS